MLAAVAALSSLSVAGYPLGPVGVVDRTEVRDGGLTVEVVGLLRVDDGFGVWDGNDLGRFVRL